jgi:hypothetical protein
MMSWPPEIHIFLERLTFSSVIQNVFPQPPSHSPLSELLVRVAYFNQGE